MADVYPFSNGTEFGYWQFANCDRCAMGYDEIKNRWGCELQKALDVAYMADGSVSESIAIRLGRNSGNRTDRCTEFLAVQP